MLAALVLGGLGTSSPARAEDDVELTVEDPQITESSALAADPTAGHYWTANDSGDEARVFAVGPDGQTLGQVGFRADVLDVEALARTADGLYVADIGDNEAERDSITVYRLTELGLGGTSVYNAWDLTYADGVARDAEAIAVTSGGDLLVITKEADGGVWTTEEPLTAAGTNTLQRIGDAPPFVTDATVLADGRVVVRSYLSVSVLDPVSFEVLASAALPLQPQGESLTTTLDGEALLVGSEGAGSQVLRVPVPAQVSEDLPEAPSEAPVDSPSAGASAPPPDGQGEDGGAGDGTDGDDAGEDTAEGPGSGASRRGTAVAIGLAALVALGAGVVVASVGRGRAGDPTTGDGNGDGPHDVAVDESAEAEGPPAAGTTDPAAAADTDPGAAADTDPGAAADTDPGAAADTDPGATPGTAATGTEAAPGSGTGPTADPDPAYVRSEDASGRVTWSEPGGDGGTPGDGRAPDHGHDLDWLYEERER